MTEIPPNESERRRELLGMLQHLRRRSPRIVEGESQFSERGQQTVHGIWVLIKIILLIPLLVLVALGSIFLVVKIIELFSNLM